MVNKLQLELSDTNTEPCKKEFNPLPDMPILGSSNSVANKDMMSKIKTII